MNKVKYTVTLDVTLPGVQSTVYAKHGDVLTREIVFALHTGGVAYRITEGCSAYLYALADGAEIFTECEISGSTVTAPLTTDILSAKESLLEVRITDAAGAVLTTPQVRVISEESLYSEDAITATNDYSALLNAITKAENARIVNITAEDKVLTVTYADGKTVSVELDIEDGSSPTIDTEETDGGYKLIINDSNGTKVLEIMNGTNGKNGTSVTITDTIQTDDDSERGVLFSDGTMLFIKNGRDGKDGLDGYTPVKGTDYFTPADINEIVNSLYAKVADGNGVAY